jgi:hypothetical protein
MANTPKGANTVTGAMAVDGRPSLFLCWLACARSSLPGSLLPAHALRALRLRHTTPRFPVFSRDASLSRFIHTRGQEPGSPVSRPMSLSSLPPNAPWGRSVSEARQAYSLALTLSRAPRLESLGPLVSSPVTVQVHARLSRQPHELTITGVSCQAPVVAFDEGRVREALPARPDSSRRIFCNPETLL